MRIERTRSLNRLISNRGNGQIKIITGIRRCGKSYLLVSFSGTICCRPVCRLVCRPIRSSRSNSITTSTHAKDFLLDTVNKL